MRAAGAKARSSKCSSAPIRKWSGRFLNEHGIGVVAPEDRRISQDILIPPARTAAPNPARS